MPSSKIKANKYYDAFYAKRPAAWRYELAMRHISSDRPPRYGSMDKPTRYLRTYLRRKESLTAHYEYEHEIGRELARRYQGLWNAEEIFQGGEDDRTKYSLEGMILAGMSDEDIAASLAVDEDTIKFYEMMFFNVRDRLDNRRYIANVIIPLVFMSGLPNRTAELTVKYFGYFGGPYILNLMLDAIDGSIPAPEDPSEVSRWVDHQFRLRIRASALVGITFFEPKDYNIRSLLEGFGQLLSLSHREQSESGEDTVINQAFETFARTIKIPLGDEGDKIPSRPGPIYAGGAVEPRVSEVSSLVAGHIPASFESYTTKNWEDPMKRRLKDASETDQSKNS